MSLLDLQHLNQQIKNKLFELSYKIECFNKSGESDISRYAETYFKTLLNIIYKHEGWNFQKALKVNQDTYDLYDIDSKVCVQITSNNRQSKKNSTIKQFEAKKHHQKFETLLIIFTTNKKPKKNSVISKSYKYMDFDITEFGSIIEGKCNQSDLLQIRDILLSNHELPRNIDTPTIARKNNIRITEKEFIRVIKLEKDLKAELLLPEYWKKIESEELLKCPAKKFKDSRFILRSIEDESYPNVDNNSSWERTFMYDFYDRGVLIWLDAVFGTKAIMNENREWYIKDLEDRKKPIPKGCFEVSVRILGKLPYKNIVHFKDGDEYYNDCHLYCKYIGIRNSPYEEIMYLTETSWAFIGQNLIKIKKLISKKNCECAKIQHLILD